MFTLTAALPPAETVTLGVLKVALHKAKGTPLPDGLAGFGELELS